MSRSSHNRFANLTSFVIPIWAIVLTLVCSSLMVGHWVSLPTPAIGSTLESAELQGKSPINTRSTLDRSTLDRLPAEDRWLVSHFLYADCPCSRKVLDYVVHREPLANVNERIVLIGHPQPTELEAAQAKFSVELISPEALLAQYGVESAPLLVVTDRDGTIKYAGGYTHRKQGLDYQDQSIVRQLVAGSQVDSLPLYGCAVSQRLKRIIDPMSLK